MPRSTSVKMILLPLAVAAGLTLTACGASIGGSPTASAGSSVSSSLEDGPLPTDMPGETRTAQPQMSTAPLNMQVRVVNLWSAQVGQTGGPSRPDQRQPALPPGKPDQLSATAGEPHGARWWRD